MTVRDEIIAAAVAALTPISGVTVYGWKETPATRDDGTQIVVKRASDNPAARVNQQQEREFNFVVEVTARGATPDVLCDAILEQVLPLLKNDVALRGKAAKIIEGPTTWETDSADTDACVATAIFIALYRTSEKSLS